MFVAAVLWERSAVELRQRQGRHLKVSRHITVDDGLGESTVQRQARPLPVEVL
jgi:hypothetical protein